MAGNKNSGPRRITVPFPRSGEVKIYANKKVADALDEITKEMPLYHGVRLAQVLEAAYEQGRRDGRADVFGRFDELKKDPDLKHLNPGQQAARKR